MVLIEQTEALLDFLEGNRDLALGHIIKSKEGRSLSKKCWTQCAQVLNSVEPNCPKKTAEEWRTYYNELKYKTLRKIKKQRAEQSANGGVSKKFLLTPSQDRLYNILGGDVEDSKPVVRHNPLSFNYGSVSPTPSSSRENTQQQRPSPRWQQQTQDADGVQLDGSEERLERIEQRHAEAVLAQARATDRLAAAMELIANRLSEPFTVIHKNEPPTQ